MKVFSYAFISIFLLLQGNMEDVESQFGKVWELGMHAGNGDIQYVRRNVKKVRPDEVKTTYGQPDGKVMTWFLIRLSDVYEEPYPNWEQKLSVIVDILQSHGFRVEPDDLSYPFNHHFKGCIQRIDFLNMLLRIGLKLPQRILSYRDGILESLQSDLQYIHQARRLPSIPKNDLEHSEHVFSHFTEMTGFDIHKEELNVLRGKAVSGYIPKKQLMALRKMEDFFRSNSPLSRESYVFRGMRISSMEDLDLDPDTVTFVTWDIDKALNYFFSPASDEDKENSMPVLLVIKLDPGTPIIRTRFPQELVLPTGSYFKLLGNPILLHNIFCHEQMKGNVGAILNVQYIPTKRKRTHQLYREDIPLFQHEDDDDYS